MVKPKEGVQPRSFKTAHPTADRYVHTAMRGGFERPYDVAFAVIERSLGAAKSGASAMAVRGIVGLA